MMRLNWFHKWFVKVARKLGAYGTLDTDAALREKNRKIIELEKALAERPIVYIHTATAPQIGGYEPPSPTTNGKIAALGMRQVADERKKQEQEQAFRHQLQALPPGTLSRHHDTMKHQKARITRELDPETISTLHVVKPPRKVELRASDDDFLL